MRLSARFARQRISIFIVSYIKFYIKSYIKLRFDKLNYEMREQCEYKRRSWALLIRIYPRHRIPILGRHLWENKIHLFFFSAPSNNRGLLKIYEFSVNKEFACHVKYILLVFQISCKFSGALRSFLLDLLSNWTILVYPLTLRNNRRLIGTLYSVIYNDQRNVQDKIPSFLYKAQKDKRLGVKATAFNRFAEQSAVLVALIVYR